MADEHSKSPVDDRKNVGKTTKNESDNVVGGASSERARKDHDERVKMIRERQEIEHERRLAELRVAEERGEHLIRSKELEREKRVKEMRERDAGRRQAVEERRKQLEMSDNEKRRQILAKYNNGASPSAADGGGAAFERSPTSAASTASSFSPRTSAQRQSFNGKKSTYAFGSSTPRMLAYLENLDPTMKLYNTKLHSSDAVGRNPLVDNDSMMTASMYGGPHSFARGTVGRRSLVTSSSSHATHSVPKPASAINSRHNEVGRGASVASPDLSFASTSMTMSFALGDSPSVLPTKNVRRQGHFTSNLAAVNRNASFTSRAKSTSTPPNNSKELAKNGTKSHSDVKPPRDSHHVPDKSLKPQLTAHSRPKSTSVDTKKPKEKSVVGAVDSQRFADENVEVTMNTTTLTANVLTTSEAKLPVNVGTKKSAGEHFGDVADGHLENGDSAEVDSSVNDNENGQTFNGEVQTPSKTIGGKPSSKEEAVAALAERRRLAREQLEREKELERQREEQQRLEEEEQMRREEEEFRRQEEEERKFLEEARKAEEQRLQLAIEEQRRRREEEELAAEEERRRASEIEAKAREQAERAERERVEKLRKEEEDRLERKKKLDAIMQRTRQSTVDGGELNGDEAINNNANGKSVGAASSVMRKLTDDVGRSVGSILNRVRSTTKADKQLISGKSDMSASMSASTILDNRRSDSSTNGFHDGTIVNGIGDVDHVSDVNANRKVEFELGSSNAGETYKSSAEIINNESTISNGSATTKAISDGLSDIINENVVDNEDESSRRNQKNLLQF